MLLTLTMLRVILHRSLCSCFPLLPPCKETPQTCGSWMLSLTQRLLAMNEELRPICCGPLANDLFSVDLFDKPLPASSPYRSHYLGPLTHTSVSPEPTSPQTWISENWDCSLSPRQSYWKFVRRHTHILGSSHYFPFFFNLSFQLQLNSILFYTSSVISNTQCLGAKCAGVHLESLSPHY